MEGTVFTYIFSRYLHMKGEGGHPPLLLGHSLPPYKPNQQVQYGGGIQSNLEMYRNLEGAIYRYVSGKKY